MTQPIESMEKRTEVLATRVQESEAKVYVEIAKLQHMTVSDWLRTVAAKAAADYLK